MSGGEVVKTRFFAVNSKEPEGVTPDFITEIQTLNYLDDCCFYLDVFGHLADTSDYYKNDVSSFLWDWSLLFTSAVIQLQKCDGTAYTTVATLNTNTLGTFYAFGFESDDFNNTKYIGFQLDWHKVLNAHGKGLYRVICVGTDINSQTVTKTSLYYNLRPYNKELANGTVRFDFYLNGILGDIENRKRRFNYKDLNWFNQVRLRGFFGLEKSPEYEREYNRYQDGTKVYINDNMKNTYDFSSYKTRYTGDVHNLLKTKMLQSDELFVTNYDSNATGQYVDFAIIPDSGYEPKWSYGNSKLAAVDLKFTDKMDIYQKKRER